MKTPSSTCNLLTVFCVIYAADFLVVYSLNVSRSELRIA